MSSHFRFDNARLDAHDVADLGSKTISTEHILEVEMPDGLFGPIDPTDPTSVNAEVEITISGMYNINLIQPRILSGGAQKVNIPYRVVREGPAELTVSVASLMPAGLVKTYWVKLEGVAAPAAAPNPVDNRTGTERIVKVYDTNPQTQVWPPPRDPDAVAIRKLTPKQRQLGQLKALALGGAFLIVPVIMVSLIFLAGNHPTIFWIVASTLFVAGLGSCLYLVLRKDQNGNTAPTSP